MNPEEITSTIKATFGTPHGQKLLMRFKEVFIDRAIYVKGSTLEETAYRQGQYDLVAQIIKDIERR